MIVVIQKMYLNAQHFEFKRTYRNALETFSEWSHDVYMSYWPDNQALKQVKPYD